MGNWTVLGVVVGCSVAAVAAVTVALLAWRRRRAAPAGVAGTVDGRPLVGRRRVLEQGLIGLFVAALAGVVSSVFDFLWPDLTGTTGGRYTIGAPGELVRRIRQQGTPYYEANGHFYVATYPAADLRAASGAYHGAVLDGMEIGFVALSQRCPHLGCRVPFCKTSQWFECPCHGSRFNGVGERQSGPSPRGMDHYAVTVEAGAVVVDTRRLYPGAPPGTATVEEPPRGPHCYG